MPPHLKESTNSDDYVKDSSDDSHVTDNKTVLLTRGRAFLREVYGADQAVNIENALYGMSPRLGHYSVPLVYGGIYSDTRALSPRDVRPS